MEKFEGLRGDGNGGEQIKPVMFEIQCSVAGIVVFEKEFRQEYN